MIIDKIVYKSILESQAADEVGCKFLLFMVFLGSFILHEALMKNGLKFSLMIVHRQVILCYLKIYLSLRIIQINENTERDCHS